MTDDLVYSSSPVFWVDDALTPDLARDTEFLEVREDTLGLRRLRLRLLGRGPSDENAAEEPLNYLDGRALSFGSSLRVAIGPGGSAEDIFEGRVTGICAELDHEREPRVEVLAEDALMSLRMVRRSRTYRDVTDAGVAQQIASEHALQAEVDAPGPSYEALQQWNMSDLAFLRERARLLQAEIWVKQGKLHFKTRPRRSGKRITLVQGDHLLSVRLEADLAHQRTRVSVAGYDAQRREAVLASSDERVVRNESHQTRLGPGILRQAFGERPLARVLEVPHSREEAEAFANAEMLRRSRGLVLATAVTRGVAELDVGSRVRLERVGQPFEGSSYYVTEVCHTFDLVDGHRTRFAAERSFLEEVA